jgi:hypothetical protein
VPPVGALIGLNATLPSSLTQNLMTQNLMTERGVTGQRKPAAISAGDARGSDRLGHVLDLVLEVAVGDANVLLRLNDCRLFLGDVAEQSKQRGRVHRAHGLTP